jgi:hypothetical protein
MRLMTVEDEIGRFDIETVRGHVKRRLENGCAVKLEVQQITRK